MRILMFSRGMGVGTGRVRDFDIFELSFFSKSTSPGHLFLKSIKNATHFLHLFYFSTLFAAYFVNSDSPGATLSLHLWFDAINDVINVL